MKLTKRIKRHWRSWKRTRISSDTVKELALYPDLPQKSLSQIRSDLYWLCRNRKRGSWSMHDTINDYFNMGIDRAGEDVRAYVFRRELDRARNAKQPISATLLKDKWITARYLQTCGVATTMPVLYKTSFVSAEEGIRKILNSGEKRFFAKRVDGTLGAGAFPFSVQGDKFIVEDQEITGEELMERLDRFIVEPYIDQHDAITNLYPNGVSSARIVSICENGNIEIILATFLVGAGGLQMSNFHQGGLRIPIDIKTGELEEKGLRVKVGRGWYTEHPDTGVAFKGFVLPYWDEVIKLIMLCHQSLPSIHSVGWDIAFSKTGPLLIEGNHRWVPHSFQYTYGAGREFMRKYLLK